MCYCLVSWRQAPKVARRDSILGRNDRQDSYLKIQIHLPNSTDQISLGGLLKASSCGARLHNYYAYCARSSFLSNSLHILSFVQLHTLAALSRCCCCATSCAICALVAYLLLSVTTQCAVRCATVFALFAKGLAKLNATNNAALLRCILTL